MTQEYYSLPTTFGLNYINDHVLSGDPFITDGWYIALGTGALTPTLATEALVNKIYDKDSEDYPGIVIGVDPIVGRYAEVQVPFTLQGNIITEAGLFDSGNNLIISSKTFIDMTKSFAEGNYRTFKVRISLNAVPADLELITVNPPGNYLTAEQVTSQLETALDGYQLLSQKDQANGYAGLDENNKVLLSELPSFLTPFSMNSGNVDANGNASILNAPGSGSVVDTVSVTTPNMTSSSVSGYTATGSIALFNSNSSVDGGNNNSTITFPEEFYVTQFNFGNVFKGQNLWYVARTATATLYRDGEQVWTRTVNPRDLVNGILYLDTPILADSGYRNVGYNSDWHYSAGGEYTSANNAEGCTISGYKYVTVSVSTATALYFNVGGAYPSLALTYADKSQEILTRMASIPGLTTNGTYTVLKEKGLNPVAVLSSKVSQGKILPVSPSNGDYFCLTATGLQTYKRVSGAWVKTQYVPIGGHVVSGGVITSVFTNTYNKNGYDTNEASFPSNKYIDLTLGASGSTYTAPTDGWLHLRKVITATSQFAQFNTGICIMNSQASTIGYPVNLLLPVKGGTVTTIYYDAAGTTELFRFIYAEGSKP